jgi:hypothetical protein
MCQWGENVWGFRISIDGAEGLGRSVGGKVSVVAFSVVINQIIWVADPIPNCVVEDIFLVSKLQQDCGVWVEEGDRVFRDDEG